MNAGIPAREVKDAMREVEVMSPTGACVRHLPRDALRFEYRALRGLAVGLRDPVGALRGRDLDSGAGASRDRPPARAAQPFAATERPVLRLGVQEPAGRLRRASDRVRGTQGPAHRRSADLTRARELHHEPGRGDRGATCWRSSKKRRRRSSTPPGSGSFRRCGSWGGEHERQRARLRDDDATSARP